MRVPPQGRGRRPPQSNNSPKGNTRTVVSKQPQQAKKPIIVGGDFELPFNLKERRLSDHIGRNLHRVNDMPPDMLRVSCPWVEISVPNYMLSYTGYKLCDESIKHIPQISSPADIPHIEIRALIVFRIKDTPGHISESFNVLCTKDETAKPFIQCMGGVVAAEVPKEDYPELLCEMVSSQSDISIKEWLPLSTFEYRYGRRVHFFIPKHLPDVLSPKEQVSKESTDDSKDTKVMIKPTKIPLLNLLVTRLAGIPRGTAELALAADTYYEFLRREMTQNVKKYLIKYAESRRVIDFEKAERRASLEDLKRKHADDHQNRKKLREEEDIISLEEWKKESWGLTMDEKDDIVAEHTREVAATRKKQDSELDNQYHSQREHIEKPPGNTVVERDHNTFSSFQILDRQKTGLVCIYLLSRVKVDSSVTSVVLECCCAYDIYILLAVKYFILRLSSL